MPLDIDTTHLPQTDRIIPRCKVIDLGSGNAPKFVTVEFPGGDGARTLARWTGQPTIAVDDFVKIQRRGIDKQYDIVDTDAGTVSGVLNNYAATTAPDANDDSGDGYAVGSAWFDVTNDQVYFCVDATATAAVWNQVGTGGGGVLPLPDKITLIDDSLGTAATHTTLAAAISASAAGDVIILGIGTFTCNAQTLTNGVNLIGVDRELSILSQTADATCLTLGTGNYAANFTVSMSINSASARVAVVATDCHLSGVTISAANAGAGTAGGLSVLGTSFVHNCDVSSDSNALFVSTGTCKVEGGNFDGSEDVDVNNSTTAYFGMPVLVNGDLSNFGTVIGAYQDGNTGRVVPGTSTFIPLASANDLLRISAHSGTLFSALINGAPSGASVVYDTVTGNEDSIVPVATGELGKLRLYNSTQTAYALIEAVDTGTNTITVTDSADISGWANNDAIQVDSNVNTDTVGGFTFFDVELDTAEIDSLATVMWVQISSRDTGATGELTQLHPHETGASGKRINAVAYLTGTNSNHHFPVKLVSGRFTMASQASGSGTKYDTLRAIGYEVSVQ